MTPVHPFPVLAFQVLRIIVHEKIVVDGVVVQTVLVEFANAEGAAKAKAALDGQHIYDDCCGLKVCTAMALVVAREFLVFQQCIGMLWGSCVISPT